MQLIDYQRSNEYVPHTLYSISITFVLTTNTQYLHNLRHTPPRLRSLRQLALRLIISISLINRQIMFLVTRRLLNTLPLLHLLQPRPPPLPNLLILASLALLRDPQTTLEVIKDLEPDSPRRDNDVD